MKNTSIVKVLIFPTAISQPTIRQIPILTVLMLILLKRDYNNQSCNSVGLWCFQQKDKKEEEQKKAWKKFLRLDVTSVSRRLKNVLVEVLREKNTEAERNNLKIWNMMPSV